MIKYLGSKRVLVPALGQLASASGARTALDLFTGTTRVAQEFCRQGIFTIACDLATYSEVLAQTYVVANACEVDNDEVNDALAHLSSLSPYRGYFTETFCEKSRFFQPKNGMRIDAIRDGIEEHYGDSHLHPYLLTSLMEAADAVDSTVGVQMAYLKQWAPRSRKDLRLRPPVFTPGTGKAIRGDANVLVDNLPHVELAYLDPPYNQHRYFTNYHIWETLIRWDSPEYYGVACKRADAKDEETKSIFNSRRAMAKAFADLISRVKSDLLVVSFSNEGFLTIHELIAMCQARGDTVKVLEFDHARYVGARIGIFGPSGKKVGRISHTRNTEYVLLSGSADAITRISDRIGKGQ
ncbi:MAG: DNA adenine methylase [Actinomycetaceae bacterium]|nr:DNA adenine methylase [Actinomycetaceae bacterium]